MRSRSSRALFSTALSAIAVALTLAPPAHAALGTVLRDNDPGGPQVNGRGIAFDGQNLYYSGALNSNIYKMTPQGGPGSALGVIPVPSGDPRIAFGGPLAWDGLALWTIDESAALILYKVDPVSGSTLFSCNIATANPGHPALAGLVNPDGLDWDGSRLVLSGGRSNPVTSPNAIALINTDCTIASWFPAVTGQGAPGWGTSGVTSDGVNIWHATPVAGGVGAVIFETTPVGTLTGQSFVVARQTVDLAYDAHTFAPTCAIWGHEGSLNDMSIPPNIKKEHVTAYEIPCPNHPPTCDAGGPYGSECRSGTGTVNLTGLGSTDPDGDQLSYLWTTDCVGGSFSNDASATPSMTSVGPPPCPVACTVSLTVSDSHGHDVSCSAPVGITDNTPPDVTVPQPISLECQGPNGVPASDPQLDAWILQASASDSCNTASLVNNAPTDFPISCQGVATDVTFTGTDACGNTAMNVSGVTVTDTVGPVVTVPGRLRIQCDTPNPIPASDPRIQAWLAQAQATDLCSTFALDNNADVFPTMCKGPQEVEVFFTGTDACGNATQQIGQVKVVDEVEPVLRCPNAITLPCPDGPILRDPAVLAWLNSAAATDACWSTGVTVAPVLPAGFDKMCKPGTNFSIQFAAKDPCGNLETCTRVISFTKPVRVKKSSTGAH